MNKDSLGYPILFMAVLTIIFTSVLAFLNYNSIDAIAYNEETDLRKTILYVFDIDADFEDPKDIERAFNESVEEIDADGERKEYVVKKDGKIEAYAFPVGGNGLWGTIEGYAAVSADYNTLLGVDFVSHSETPGLGGRISEEWYKSQFRGVDLTEADEEFLVYRPSPEGNVDAISGATQTSKAVSNFLNEDIYEYINEGKEAK